MSFLAGVVPPESPDPAAGPPLLFAFKGDELLVVDATFAVPRGLPSDLGSLGLHVERTQFIGTLDGASCFAFDVEVGDGTVAEPPAGHRFAGIRALYGAMPEEELAIAGTAFQVMHWDRGHQFCARCGRPLAAKPTERAKRCDVCRVDYFPRIHPAMIVLVHDETRILMARPPRFPAKWYALVAGFLEPGETFEECAAREVLEETGIVIDDLRYFGNQPWPFPHQVMVGFFARAVSREITIDRTELEDARWFDASAMPELPSPISIARRMIDAWLEQQRASS